MNTTQQYEKLLKLTAQIGELLQGETDTLAADDLLTIIQQRQDLMTQISEAGQQAAGSVDEAAVEQLIYKIQSMDQVNYSALEKMKLECSVKLNNMRQNNEAFDAYNPISNEASAFFVDKKR